MRSAGLSLLIILLFCSQSCSDSSFFGSGKAKKSSEQQPPQAAQNDPIAGLSNSTAGCITKAVPLNLLFVMDVSGSMKTQSDVVQSSFAQLAMQLQNLQVPGIPGTLPVRYGLITHEDSIIYSSNALLTDMQMMQQAMSVNFKAVERMTDNTEAGILALQHALLLVQRESEPGITVVVQATDGYIHDGSGTNAGVICLQKTRSGSLVALDSLFRDPKLKNFLLFDAAPSRGGKGASCFIDSTGSLPGAASQFENIRMSWRNASGAMSSPAGAHLADQLNNNSQLVNTLPNMLTSMIRACH